MDQSMNFHSDDEVGVQGVITSLSLGSAARMSFRRKVQKDELSSGKNAVCLDLILRHVCIISGFL
jgi:alkylated DNA repair dioxygenase AlkB